MTYPISSVSKSSEKQAAGIIQNFLSLPSSNIASKTEDLSIEVRDKEYEEYWKNSNPNPIFFEGRSTFEELTTKYEKVMYKILKIYHHNHDIFLFYKPLKLKPLNVQLKFSPHVNLDILLHKNPPNCEIEMCNDIHKRTFSSIEELFQKIQIQDYIEMQLYQGIQLNQEDQQPMVRLSNTTLQEISIPPEIQAENSASVLKMTMPVFDWRQHNHGSNCVRLLIKYDVEQQAFGIIKPESLWKSDEEEVFANIAEAYAHAEEYYKNANFPPIDFQ